ncbi:MAG: TIR domain-containing protein [Candidatus Lokiarchaeota archaeon]|nr:TIR domain-containing protein [Candidatus Lokiarchaeota archaeon]
MSDDKRINKDERKTLEEIERICGIPFRRVNMTAYNKVENLFNIDENGFINMLGFDLKKLDLDEEKINLLGDFAKQLKSIETFLFNIPEGKKVPEWLKDLNFVKELILRSSNLPAIPECIKDFKNLKTLFITGNRIAKLPEWLPTLNGLKWLNLNDTTQTLDLTSSNMDILRALHEKNIKVSDPTFNLHINFGVPLEHIEIIKKISWKKDGLNRVFSEKLDSIDAPWRDPGKYGVNLRIFDGKILHLSITQQLGKEETKINDLPEDFGKLQDLTIISLTGNKINALPESIGELKNLKQLMLSDNQLISLPELFVNLTSLQKLDLSNNKFNQIPTQLWALTELTELNLTGNDLSSEENTIIQKVPDLIREYLRKKATIRVFISHAVVDFESYRIGDLVNYLKKQKEISEVYFCEADLAGNIDEWMLDAVQKCQLILFIGTKKSVFNSVDCANELQLADKFSIPIIPIKGYDVDWSNLAEKNLSRELGLEFDKDNFDAFCEDLYKYIENFKREINLMEKKERRQGIIDIYERFRLILDEVMSDINRKLDSLGQRLAKLENK